MKETEKSFINDLFHILMELNQESKNSSKSDPVAMGKHLAYYDVLSILHMQISAFGIDPADVGMQDFNPDRDAL